MRRQALAAVAAVAAITATVVTTSSPSAAPVARAAAPTDVIVHLFEWPWASVAAECQNVLGPKGFGGRAGVAAAGARRAAGQGYPVVAGLPAGELPAELAARRPGGVRVDGADLPRGRREDLRRRGDQPHGRRRVDRRRAAAGRRTRTTPTRRCPYGDGDFHHCGRNGNDDIVNWGDRWEVQNCELVDLSDLKTESQYVRDKLAGYLNDLISLGVDGFRVDAAKHMPVGDLQASVRQLNGNPVHLSRRSSRAARARSARRSTPVSAT